jgi:hypothetical protein
VKLQIATALVALASVAVAFAAGPDHVAAPLGAILAGVTGVGSTLLMGRAATTAKKPMQAALLVFVIFFLLRLVLVGSATAVVVRFGWNVVAFVVAFFVPYFVLSALEGAYLHSLRRTGIPA